MDRVAFILPALAGFSASPISDRAASASPMLHSAPAAIESPPAKTANATSHWRFGALFGRKR